MRRIHFLCIFLEKVESKLRTVSSYLVDKVFKRFHPELVDGQDELIAWAFEFSAVTDHAFEILLKLLDERGVVKDH